MDSSHSLCIESPSSIDLGSLIEYSVVSIKIKKETFLGGAHFVAFGEVTYIMTTKKERDLNMISLAYNTC